ncbi:AraC family transcriptional regulator [Halomonas halocynthiae]|uniref:AraC family transcriptional regulator n=1 Tax=Halomonas halocynthiae TaxID=176290 RepID=UPI0003FE6EF8|nr:AraC family transcriptional regulator [Halomonas halocynthiae]
MALSINTPARQQIAMLAHTPDDAWRWMRSINGPHALDVPRPRDLSFRHEGTTLGNLSIGILEYATNVHIQVQDLAHSYSISLPLGGSQSIEHQQDEFISDCATAAIISPHQPLRLTMTEDCQKHLVRLSREAVKQRLEQLLGRRVTAPIVFDPRMQLNGALKDWWKTVTHLQELLSAEHSMCDLPEVWGNFESGLVTSLLFAQPHNYSVELHDRQQQRPSYLAHLESLMANTLKLGQTLTLEDMEKASHVSRERLYLDFHTFFGTTPVAYFRQMRYEEAHQRMINASCNESVSSIAMDCGFMQLGRFSKEYQVRFGEQPSETLKRHTH